MKIEDCDGCVLINCNCESRRTILKNDIDPAYWVYKKCPCSDCIVKTTCSIICEERRKFRMTIQYKTIAYYRPFINHNIKKI